MLTGSRSSSCRSCSAAGSRSRPAWLRLSRCGCCDRIGPSPTVRPSWYTRWKRVVPRQTMLLYADREPGRGHPRQVLD